MSLTKLGGATLHHVSDIEICRRDHVGQVMVTFPVPFNTRVVSPSNVAKRIVGRMTQAGLLFEDLLLPKPTDVDLAAMRRATKVILLMRKPDGRYVEALAAVR